MKTNLSILSIILILITGSYALDTPTVAVVNDSTNQYGQYTIDAALRPGNLLVNPIQMAANEDTFRITFSGLTVLPTSVNPSHITINGVASSGTRVEDQTLYVQTPVEIRNFLGGDRNFTIVISSAAKIRNPITSGDYTLSVYAHSGGFADDGPATSDNYTIYQASSTITTPSAAPNPALAAQSAAYNVSFFTGSAGYLTAGSSTITMGFDSMTVVPEGGIYGVLVNDIAASAIASDDTVVITVQSDVDNEATVTVEFPLGTGIQNPSAGGNYALGVKTSSENTFVESDSFAISGLTDFSISSVSLYDNTANTVSEYSVEFRTSSSGALTANTDTLALIFPQNTDLPATMNTTDIVVSSGGFSDNAYSVFVKKDVATDNDTIFVVTPFNIENAATATITVKNSAGVMNPSEEGNFKIKLMSSQEPSTVESNSYTITIAGSSVSQALITPASSATSAVTSYSVLFNLGNKGRLYPGVSTITVKFDSDYSLQTTSGFYDNSTITVGEGSPVALSFSNIDVDNTEKTITVTVPGNVTPENSNTIELIFDGTVTDPITNPSTAAEYTMIVSTTVEPSEVLSNTYAIGGTAITSASVTLTDSSANANSGYTVDIDLNSTLNSLEEDWVKLVFPEGTVLPASIDPSNVTFTSGNASSVNVIPSTRTFIAGIPFIFASDTETLTISAAAGIINPAVTNTSYSLLVNTSKDIIPVSTPDYAITGNNTQVTSVSATAAPPVRNQDNVAYTVNFTTSSNGKLVGGTAFGSSTIDIDFDVVTVVPASIPPGNVKINNTACENVSVTTSGNGGIVQVSVPSGLSIDNSTAVEVAFDTSAGLDTRDLSGTYDAQVTTSSDTMASDISGTAGDYTIEDTQSMYVSSITVSPDQQNAAGGYTVKFTTGSLGGLSTGDTIRIVFPVNTSVPAAINASDILVNGVNPASNPVISGNTLKIPVGSAISALTNVTVLINQSANILNPTTLGSYTVNLNTDAETTFINSPTYTITQTTTRTTVADVNVASPTPSSTSAYSISFSTGANGRLIAGTSTISVTFNSSTTVNGTPANYDATFITVDGSQTQIGTGNISINGREVTFTIPAGVSVDNSDAIILDISGTTPPITNPSSSGGYTIQVRTSVETSEITSNVYTISDVTPVTGITNAIGSDIVNAATTYTVSFRVAATGGALAAGSGTITVTFPNNTFLPATMATNVVQVANGAAPSPTNYTNANAVSVNTFTRTVVVTVPNVISDNHYVIVAFLSGAGLENPSNTGGYTLDVKTSSQPLNGESASYTLQATNTTISGLSVSISPQTVSQPGRFQYNFTTGSRGRLISGQSLIYLLLPDDISFSQGTPQTSKVTVNSTAAEALSRNQGTGQEADTLLVTVPLSVTIGNSTAVTVIIDETAGVITPSTADVLTYSAYTSVESAGINFDKPLPVDLTSFTASAGNGRVTLNWITAAEIENEVFIIDRSTDGENFEFLAEIEGQGTISRQTKYSYIDKAVINGFTYHYRLADRDYNGVLTHHQSIQATPNSSGIDFSQTSAVIDKFALQSVYPNPFNPETTIRFEIPNNDNKVHGVKMMIYNTLGQRVATLFDGELAGGRYKVKWDGIRQASGVYYLHFQSDTYVKTQKMLLVR